MKIDNYRKIPNLLNKDLLVNSKNNLFIIKEEKKESGYTHIKLKGDDKTLVLKQDIKGDNDFRFTLDVLEKRHSTNKMCDFIVLYWDKEMKIKLCFCELKKNPGEKQLKKASKQIKASKFFMKCIFQAIEDYFEIVFDDINIDIDNAKGIVITPLVYKNTTEAKYKLFIRDCEDKGVIEIDQLIK